MASLSYAVLALRRFGGSSPFMMKGSVPLCESSPTPLGLAVALDTARFQGK